MNYWNRSFFTQFKIVFAFILLTSSFQQVFGQENSNHEKIRIASCQFPVSSSISSNLEWIKKQMNESSLKNVDVVHFSECALSGYPGVDMKSMDGFDWNELHTATDSIMVLAKKLKIWIIFGSIHKLAGNNKPYNSLYVVNDKGEIVDRYDKRFCTDGDLEYFSSGSHFVNFEINGVNCGLLICYDVRFPELFRQYRKLDTDVIFHSFHNARMPKEWIHPIIMPITAQARAATNFFYMSLTNSSVSESWPCHFITPDGLIQNKLTTNKDGVLISDIDLKMKYYDASKPYRSSAIDGKLNSGEILDNSLSKNRTGY